MTTAYLLAGHPAWLVLTAATLTACTSTIAAHVIPRHSGAPITNTPPHHHRGAHHTPGDPT